MIDVSNFGKGAIEKPMSRKDYRLEVVAGAIVLPRKFSLRDKIARIKNQGSSLSCVAQSYAYYIELLNYLETGEHVEMSARDTYSRIYQPEGGAYSADGASKLCNYGNVTEKNAISYENGNPPSEAFMRTRGDITADEVENGKTYITKKYVTWDNTKLDLFKQAVIQGNGAVGISWGNNVLWRNANVALPLSPSQMEWRHQIFITGYDDDKKCFEFVNSWSEQWGDIGFGYLPYEYVTKGYVSNPITLIDVPNETYVSLMSQIKNLKDMIAKLLGLKK